MSQLRLLSMDFDGTLIRSWALPPFPKKLVRILNRLRRQGVLIAFNTGRNIQLVEEGLGEAGFPIRPDFALTCEREVFRWSGSGWEDYGEWNSRCREDHGRLFSNAEPLLIEICQYVESTTGARLYYEEGRFVGVVSTTNAEMDAICGFIDTKCIEVPEFGIRGIQFISGFVTRRITKVPLWQSCSVSSGLRPTRRLRRETILMICRCSILRMPDIWPVPRMRSRRLKRSSRPREASSLPRTAARG